MKGFTYEQALSLTWFLKVVELSHSTAFSGEADLVFPPCDISKTTLGELL